MSLAPVALSVFVACSFAGASAAPVPQLQPPPLPKGATARLGSPAFRVPPAGGVTFSADGQTLYALEGGNQLAWDADSGLPYPSKPLAPKKAHEPNYQWFPAGERLFRVATEQDPETKVWTSTLVVRERETGKELSRTAVEGRVSLFPPSDRSGPMRSAAVSADGTLAALASSHTGRVTVFDTATGTKLHDLRYQERDFYRSGCVFSTDGTALFVFDASGPVRRCAARTGNGLIELAGTDERTDVVYPSADGRVAVTRSRSAEKGAKGPFDPFVRVHDAVANKVTHRLEIGGRPDELALADGALFVRTWNPDAPDKNALSRWSIRTGKREWERTLDVALDGLVAAPNGKRVALVVRASTIHTFDGTTGAPADPLGHRGPVRWIGWSADGGTVRTASYDGLMKWTVRGDRRAVACPAELRTAAFPPFYPGNTFAALLPDAAYKNWELALWDFEANKFAWRTPVRRQHYALRVVFARDAARAAVLYREEERGQHWEVWEHAGPGKKPRAAGTFRADEGAEDDDGSIWSGLAQSADGKALYLAGEGVRAFDLDTGKARALVPAVPRPAYARNGVGHVSLAVSADAGRVAVIPAPAFGEPPNGEYQLTVFDVAKGQQLSAHAFKTHGLARLAFDSNGTRVVAWAWAGEALRVYSANKNDAPLDFTRARAKPTCVAFSPNGASLAVGYYDGTALIWDLTARPKE